MFPRHNRLRKQGKRTRSRARFVFTRTALVTSVICLVAIVSAYVAFASISLSTSVPYIQPFDGMGIPLTNPAPSNLPADFRVDTIASVRTLGNYFSASNQTTRVGGANMPTNAANGPYNFGAGTTTLGGPDRAVGFVSSGTATMSGNLYAELINDSGNNLTGLQVSYNVEKYRNGSNPSGFRIQLYYSNDSLTWTSAGPDFLTSFTPDLDNSGFATAPGATASVNNTLSVAIPTNAKFYLAWNYSVASGFTTTNAQALGIDNISILGLGEGDQTSPSGIGSASPNSVAAGGTTLLTVAVTPGTNPTSLDHSVTADLSAIGGSSSQTLFDDGTNGDVSPGDNVFSYSTNVANGTSGGLKNLPFTIQEVGGLGRMGTGAIALTVLSSTNPSGVGGANPNSVLPGENSVLTVSVTPGANPTSTGLAVTADLSTIGGSSTQQFFDDGVSGGDTVANDNVFTYATTVAVGTSAGGKSLGFSVTDDQGRTGSGSILLTVQQPPPPADHVVVSQLYGGGGNSGASFTNDYVELYNPTGISFDLAGWSLQYASATGSSWSNKQPLGGVIAPGEYFLVKLGSGGAAGNPLPAANIEGDINMSATTGKLALVSNSITLTGTCPNGTTPSIVDFVGYGNSANCFEGANHTPAPSNTTAVFRKFGGAQDTNQNGDDFQTGTPNPRRTSPIVELGPWIAGTDPISAGTNVPHDATISIDFSEPVDVVGNWYDISCASSGQHNDGTVASYNSAKGYHITPNTNFTFGELCTVTVFHTQVHDQDLDDSNPNTDTLFADTSWTFTVVADNQIPPAYPPDVHLTMGNPSSAVADIQQYDNYLMEKPGYALSYNRDKGTPNWVSWHLEQDWFGNLARVDTFRADPAIPSDWYRVQSTDYASSGFDRGHMTPNADRDNENRIPINQETYLMTNMVPQSPDNNQGPWAALENDLRTMLNGTQNEMYIVSGPLGVGGTGANGTANTVAGGHVTVPEYTWKVVLVLPKGDNDVSRVTAATQTIAVLIPNTQGIRNNDWHMYLTTVDNIEALTGYDFFANVPDDIENSIEAGTNGSNPPGTADQFVTTAEDTPSNITVDAVSPILNATFSSTIVSGPSHGVVSGSGLNLTYTPAPDYHGSDNFKFRVNDGTQDSNTSTVNITVTEVNDPPIANNDAITTDEDQSLNISTSDLTANDSAGPADESLQLLNVTGVSPTVNTHGSVSVNNDVVSYTPDPNFNGQASFTYQVCDNGTTNGAADAKCAGATVTVTVNPVNDNPVAATDEATTDEDQPVSIDVLANDSDVDGDTPTLQSVGTATNGSVSIAAGQALYSPNANFNGSDSFTYVVGDGHGGTAMGTVNVTVIPVNDNPVAVDDSVITDEDNSVSIDVVANDTDVDGDALSLFSVGQPTHGSTSVNAGQVIYSPAANFNGADSFTYVVSDGQGGQATGSVNITVGPVNDAPTANEQIVSTNSNSPVNITLTGIDVETALADLSFVVTVNPTHGSLSGAGANLTYTPALNYSGQDSFKFTVTDTGDGSAAPLTSAEATVSITINDTVDPTVTAPPDLNLGTGAGATTCGLFVSESTLGTASASDNSGVVSVERNGVPAGNIFPVGVTTITYIATDGAGNTAQAMQTVTVVDNTPPTVTAPAPITVQADSSGQAIVPDFVAGTVATDNCSSVTITQDPAAGTIVGIGTHTINLIATDLSGNSQTVTTSFVVNGDMTFNLSVSPEVVSLNSTVKLRVTITNNTATRQSVSFNIRYQSPCDAGDVDDVGPIPVQSGAEDKRNIVFRVPKKACTGVYIFTMDYFVGGIKMGSTTAQLTVTP